MKTKKERRIDTKFEEKGRLDHTATPHSTQHPEHMQVLENTHKESSSSFRSIKSTILSLASVAAGLSGELLSGVPSQAWGFCITGWGETWGPSRPTPSLSITCSNLALRGPIIDWILNVSPPTGWLWSTLVYSLQLCLKWPELYYQSTHWIRGHETTPWNTWGLNWHKPQTSDTQPQFHINYWSQNMKSFVIQQTLTAQISYISYL